MQLKRVFSYIIVSCTFLVSIAFGYSDTYDRIKTQKTVSNETYTIITRPGTGWCSAGILMLDGEVIFHSEDFKGTIACVIDVTVGKYQGSVDVIFCDGMGAGSGECGYVTIPYFPEHHSWFYPHEGDFSASKRSSYVHEQFSSNNDNMNIEELYKQSFGIELLESGMQIGNTSFSIPFSQYYTFCLLYRLDQTSCPLEDFISMLSSYQPFTTNMYFEIQTINNKIRENKSSQLLNIPVSKRSRFFELFAKKMAKYAKETENRYVQGVVSGILLRYRTEFFK